MKYCTKCGNKLNENSRFCNKCGAPTKIVIEERKEQAKRKNEENKEKLLLLLGTLLIVIASVIFAVINWEEMTNSFKILFLFMELLVFLSLSMFSKKLNYKLPHKFLWFIGIIFVPIILGLLPEYKIIGDLSKGNNLYVYLAISSMVCIIVYILSYRFIKSNIFLYFAYLFVYDFIISILGIFNFTTVNYIIPVINIFNLTICIFYIYIKNEIYKDTINKFLSVIIIVFSIVTSSFLIQYRSSVNDLILLITTASIVISIMLLLFKNKNIPIYFYPVCVYLLIISLSSSVFTNYENISLFLSVLGILFMYFMMAFKEDKNFNIASYIFMLLYLLISLIIYEDGSSITFAIINIFILVALIFILKINEQKSKEAYITKIIIPIIIYIIVNSLINSFFNVNESVILMISSAICFMTYIIIDRKENDEYFGYTLSISSYVLLIISGIVIYNTEPNISIFIINEIIWILYFMYNSIIKNNNVINIILLALSVFSFVILGVKYSINIHYSLLFVSFLTLILDICHVKQGKLKTPYIYISLISSALASLLNFNDIAIIGIGLNVLIYVLTYYIINKKRNIHHIITYIYTIIGFVLIYSIFNYFVSNIAFANILVLITYLIIFTCMYLLRVMDDRKIFGLTALIIIPYINIINNLNISNTYYISFNLLLYVILILVYFEKVFKLNDKDKIIFELVLLGLAHLFTINITFIFNIFLAAFYLFFAFYKKRDSFVIFGVILLIISILINIWKMFNNLYIIFALLIVGMIMLAYVFYIEAKKKINK